MQIDWLDTGFDTDTMVEVTATSKPARKMRLGELFEKMEFGVVLSVLVCLAEDGTVKLGPLNPRDKRRITISLLKH